MSKRYKLDYFIDVGLNPKATRTDEFVRQSLNDDRCLRLGNIPKRELDRLTLHFVGWTHRLQYTDRVVSYIKALHAVQLINEGLAVDWWRADLIEEYYRLNMIMRGYRLNVRDQSSKDDKRTIILTDEQVERWVGTDRITARIAILFKSATTIPILKHMDLTRDDVSETTFKHRTELRKGNLADVTNINNPYWFVYSTPAALRKKAEAFYIKTGKFAALREQKMTEDIAVAAANALQRTNKAVVIAVLCGSLHLPIEQAFQSQGIKTASQGFGINGMKIRSKNVYQYADRIATRQAIETGAVDERVINDMLLVLLVSSVLPETTRARLDEVTTRRKLSLIYSSMQFLEQSFTQSQKDSIMSRWEVACKDYAKNPKTVQFNDLVEFINNIVSEILSK